MACDARCAGQAGRYDTQCEGLSGGPGSGMALQVRRSGRLFVMLEERLCLRLSGYFKLWHRRSRGMIHNLRWRFSEWLM